MATQTTSYNGGTLSTGSYDGGVMGDLSHEWATRPPDERITGENSRCAVLNLHAKAQEYHSNSIARVVPNRDLTVLPVEGDDRALAVRNKNGQGVYPTHWAWGQLCSLASVPAGYMRQMGEEGGAALVADCVNWGLGHRDIEEVGVLVTRKTGGLSLTACTGPNYGRIWNEDITSAIAQSFDLERWTVPGIFGRKVEEVTQENTSLFLSSQDMFLGLTDEEHRIEIPGRRDGKPGSLARFILFGNSEVGAGKFFVKVGLFDYCCANRNFWGVEDFMELSFRHSSGAPRRFLEQARPALEKFMESGTTKVQHVLEEARKERLDDVDAFLQKRFTKSQVVAIKAAHLADEGRPIETVWDANVGATAYARDLPHQDERLKVELLAGQMMPKA